MFDQKLSKNPYYYIKHVYVSKKNENKISTREKTQVHYNNNVSRTNKVKGINYALKFHIYRVSVKKIFTCIS